MHSDGRFRRFMAHYQGIMLMAMGCAASAWLAATRQLTLYINPRYVTFTLVMAIIGLLFVVAGATRVPGNDDSATPRRPSRLGVVSAASIALLCAAVFVSFMVLRPATLTSSSLKQRGINSSLGATTHVSNAVPLFGGGDYSRFGVKEWAGLLAQTSDPSFFTGKSADITGFISPDESDPQNVFYVSRFVITCCAVDARPIGVPVYAPQWQAMHKPDSWVRVAGAFAANPSTKSSQHVAVRPTAITTVKQPDDPYVF